MERRGCCQDESSGRRSRWATFVLGLALTGSWDARGATQALVPASPPSTAPRSRDQVHRDALTRDAAGHDVRGEASPETDSSKGLHLPPVGEDGVVEEPEDPVEAMARRVAQFEEHLGRAEAAATRGHHDDAIHEYSAALLLQPGDATALLGRALARKARTPDGRCPTRAISDLRLLETYDPRGAWQQQRGLLLEWMADCGSSFAADRLALAKELAAAGPGAPGRPADIRVLVARLQVDGAGDRDDSDDVRRAALEELERYRGECRASGAPPVAAALQLQAELYRETGAVEQALATYRELLRIHPSAPESSGVAKMLRDLELERELQQLDETQGFRAKPEADAAYRRGTQALQAGQVSAAIAAFQQAIAVSPWFPRAQYGLGVAYAREDRFADAVEALSRAIYMDPADYQANMTLGLIYKKEFAGAEDEQAIRYLSAALRLRPDLYRMHMLLGELYARSDRSRAREHYERFIRSADPDDPDVGRARQALEELERAIRQDDPPAIAPPAEESLRFLAPELQRMINEAYLRGTKYQDVDGAERILLAAKDRFPGEPAVYNELARLMYAHDREAAQEYWRESLDLREDQVEVHERLGLLLRRSAPIDAIAHLRRAAELGSLTARFVLGQLLWDEVRPWQAAEVLETYLAEAGDYDLHYDQAKDLYEHIRARLFELYLAAGTLLALLMAWPAWRLYKRYRGKALGQLLERDPKSFPEVARVLSLIRHEILKHNTAFLADVGHAIEAGDEDCGTRAAVLVQRLFGDSSPSGTDEQAESRARLGIYGRFLGYVDELEKVGRAYRVRLNLHRKDPIFGPMLRAFENLRKRQEQLEDVSRLTPHKRVALARALNRSGEVLGRQAFEQLSGLIRELCVVRVTPGLIESVFTRVAGESQFAEAAVAPLNVTGVGCAIRVFRSDLEDILANVFRNSLRSTLAYGQAPAQIGVALVTEVDEITGLGTLAIRVQDRSPEQLSNEMLRGRYIERGMGITVDLLSRYDGSIAVEPEAQWRKAVVLRFFVLEDAGDEFTEPRLDRVS